MRKLIVLATTMAAALLLATVVSAARRRLDARSTVTSPFSTEVTTNHGPADARLNEPYGSSTRLTTCRDAGSTISIDEP